MQTGLADRSGWQADINRFSGQLFIQRGLCQRRLFGFKRRSHRVFDQIQSLPARPVSEARLHPLSRTVEEVLAIFSEMGFQVAEGPDIESDYYNFTALNIPPEHPARQEHDTFYLPPDADGQRKVLRTHTSPVQIRTMEANEPPIRIIVPGRTYRSDHDATHSPMFHQCEGLMIGDGIHICLLYTSPSPRDGLLSRMPSSA